MQKYIENTFSKYTEYSLKIKYASILRFKFQNSDKTVRRWHSTKLRFSTTWNSFEVSSLSGGYAHAQKEQEESGWGALFLIHCLLKAQNLGNLNKMSLWYARSA